MGSDDNDLYGVSGSSGKKNAFTWLQDLTTSGAGPAPGGSILSSLGGGMASLGPPGAVAGAALGLAKGIANKDEEARQKRAQIMAIRMSPWSGQSLNTIPQAGTASLIGDIASGAYAGSQRNQNMADRDAANKYLTSRAKFNNAWLAMHPEYNLKDEE